MSIHHHANRVFVNGMEITPFDDAHTYHVKSRTREGHHVVDLLENGGLGNCSCEAFNMRYFPEYRILDGTVKDKRRYRCAHIKACRELLTDELVEKLHELQKIRNARPSEF